MGDSETQLVKYSLLMPKAIDFKTAKWAAKAWINTRTKLAAKLEVRAKEDGEVLEVTDIFVEYIIDGKLDAKLFELPK